MSKEYKSAMVKEFLCVGWKFPVNVDARGNIQMSEYEQDINGNFAQTVTALRVN